MNFKYTALNKNYNKVSGFISAETEDEARKQLHKIQLSVLSVDAVSEEEMLREEKKEEEEIEKKMEAKKDEEIQEKKVGTKPKSITIFYFKAIDLNGKETDGTIDSFSDLKAFKRLVEEYQFNVLELYPQNATEEEKIKYREHGINELQDQLEKLQEKGKEKGFLSGLFAKEEKAKKGAEMEVLESLSEQSVKIQKAVDDLATKAKRLLVLKKDFISAEQNNLIKKTLDKLLLIKMSNNYHHIQKVSDELQDMLDNVLHKKIAKITREITKDEDEFEKIEDEAEFEYTYQQSLKTKNLEDRINLLTNKIDGFIGWSVEDKKSKFVKNLVGSFYNFFFGTKEIEPEITEKLFEVKKARHLLFQYIKGYIFCRDHKKRPQYKDKIKKTWGEYKKSKVELNKTLQLHKGKEAFLLDDIKAFVEWLLFFYIIYFFVFHFVLSKKILLQFDLLIPYISLPVILYIILTLFVFDFLIILKKHYFQFSRVAGPLLSIFGIFIMTIIIVNL